MSTENHSKLDQVLKNLVESSQMQAFKKADKITLIAGVLNRFEPETFHGLNNLTWPLGRAILLSDDLDLIRRTNPTAQIHRVPQSSFYIDVGHDNEAMRRLLERMLRPFGIEAGLVNQFKRLFQVKQPRDYSCLSNDHLFV